MLKAFVWCFILLISVSCTVQQTIYYDTQRIPVNLDKPAVKKRICILAFNDIRKEVAGNDLYMKSRREILDRNEIFCINAEMHYKKNPLSLQMAYMLADHMGKRGTFKSVVVNKKDSADYIIECSLARITGKQHLPRDIRNAPATGAVIGGVVGGVVGTILVSDIKSKFEVSIAITDVKIYDRNMNLVAELGSFAKDYKEENHPDASCWCSFENVSDKLKDFYSELIPQIENKIGEL